MNKRKRVLALLLAGSFFFCLGAAGRVREGVCINGVNVGGMSYAEAEKAVRERIASELAPLTIKAPFGEYVLQYPHLSFTDNVKKLVKEAGKGAQLTASVERVVVDLEEQLLAICAQNARPPVDAALTFTAEGFSYAREREGVCCDYARLQREVLRALKEGEGAVTLHVRGVRPRVTEADLRARTQLLSAFETAFDGGNAARAHNIRLAAERLSGSVIAPGQLLSFNECVGKRTAENGFLPAPVIVGGEYVAGTGGGVCQVSTTLFNAALLAGLEVAESHAHSLSVAYVPPSLDAMVSEYSDLRLKNPFSYPIYVLARAGERGVRVSLYGKPTGIRYRTESSILRRISPPPEEVRAGERDCVLRAAKAGIMSESYLCAYDEGGALLSRTRIRRDRYGAVRGIREEAPRSSGAGEGEAEIPQEGGQKQKIEGEI